MHKTKTMLELNLKLFDGAAGAAAAAPSGGEAAGNQNSAGALPKADNARNGSSRRSKSGDLSNVVYGKQDAAPDTDNGNNLAAAERAGAGNTNRSGVTTTSDALEAKRQAFKELIDGEYKEQYTEHFQKTFDRRFKEVKSMQESLANHKPIMDLLMQRYGIADGDTKALMTALEQDDRYYEEAADEAGLTVEQFKHMQKLERESAELAQLRKQAQDEARRGQQQQQVQQQLNQWHAEADALKSIYPNFDFRAEIANRDFLGLLKSGLSVQRAYEVMHIDEITATAAHNAAQTAGEQVRASVRKGASRPRENGTSSGAATIIKNDVHSFTAKDRAEIARRAQRGDIIKL